MMTELCSWSAHNFQFRFVTLRCTQKLSRRASFPKRRPGHHEKTHVIASLHLRWFSGPRRKRRRCFVEPIASTLLPFAVSATILDAEVTPLPGRGGDHSTLEAIDDRTQPHKTSTNNMDRKGRELTRRIDDLGKRGLLNPKMTEHYKMAIVKAKMNPIKLKTVVEQLQKDLDRIESEATATAAPESTPSPTSSTFSSGTSASVSAFTEIASAANSNTSSSFLNKHPTSILSRAEHKKGTAGSDNHSRGGVDKHIKWGDESSKAGSGVSELAQAYNKRALRPVNTARLEKPSVLPESKINAPGKQGAVKHVFHRNSERKVTATAQSPMVVDVESLQQEIGDEKLQELFVEMCFFARLGYLQPPCCLRCTYREALKDGNVQSQCPRWVIWRKDTTRLLHPHQLDGNLLMVQCRAAGKLLAGKKVDGYKWSLENQAIQQDGLHR